MAENEEDLNAKSPLDKALRHISDSFSKIGKKDPVQDAASLNEFFRAVKNNQKDIIQKLLDAGIDPNTYDGRGHTALHVAAINNAPDVARLLIDRGADPRRGRQNSPEHTPLQDAISFRKIDMVELLAQHGGYVPGFGVDGWSLLHRACDTGNTRAVEALLKAGVNCNERTENGTTPFLIAVKHGNKELVKILLEYPEVLGTMNEQYIKTDERKRTAFQVAVDLGYIPLVAAMIEKGADVNRKGADGMVSLMYAIENANLDLIRLLVESGTDVNASYEPYGTPLAYACATDALTDDRKRAEMIDLLLQLGADADIPSPEGRMTPLHLLLKHGRKAEALAALLLYPINTEVYNDTGELPVSIAAARYINADPLLRLLKAGANVNGRHKLDARTPLILATLNCKTDAVRTLLQAGANPHLYDGHGKSALYYAREQGQSEIAKLLEQSLNKRSASSPPTPKSGPTLP